NDPKETEQKVALDSGPGPVPGRKRRILVVDDSELTAHLLQRELSAKGFEVTTADSVDKATKVILRKQTRPDLILLDIRMPHVDGEQFCRFIKANSLFAGIKVLLCSGENEQELQRICREAGADGYLPKNAVLGQLLARELSYDLAELRTFPSPRTLAPRSARSVRLGLQRSAHVNRVYSAPASSRGGFAVHSAP